MHGPNRRPPPPQAGHLRCVPLYVDRGELARKWRKSRHRQRQGRDCARVGAPERRHRPRRRNKCVTTMVRLMCARGALCDCGAASPVPLERGVALIGPRHRRRHRGRRLLLLLCGAACGRACRAPARRAAAGRPAGRGGARAHLGPRGSAARAAAKAVFIFVVYMIFLWRYVLKGGRKN